MTFGKLFRVCAGSAVVLAAGVSASAPAMAQSIFFDWGSNETVNDSGRELVRFNDKARVGELIVSFGDRRVYYIIGPSQALSYPIAVPREKSKWAGVTSVSQKRVSPSWTPTPEMMAENPRLPPWVPGGHPMNPLGTHALYLGSSSYRIHGTDAPWTIGTAASKGCVRMYNKDVQDLYPRVPVGTKVTVTYDTYKTSPLDGDTAKGLMVSLDKGKKIKADDDVAAAADKATKKFRDGDDSGNDDGAAIHKAVAKAADLDAKDEDKKLSEDGETAGKRDAEKVIKAESEENSEPPVKKRTSERRSVETGSVDKSEAKAENSEPKAAKSKSENAERKATSAEDASAIAQRAMAAAERAAAAAERAADAAERVSAAVLKQTAATKQASAETPASEEAKPLDAWPVVRGASSP